MNRSDIRGHVQLLNLAWTAPRADCVSVRFSHSNRGAIVHNRSLPCSSSSSRITVSAILLRALASFVAADKPMTIRRRFQMKLGRRRPCSH